MTGKQYDNKNTGVLFKNNRKTEDRHPDYTGHYTDGEGREFFLDAWIREGAKGKFFSIRAKAKEARREEPADTASSPFDDAGWF
jgi:hypothetical protein